MHHWVLLLYKVPPEPSARRVYVWRKLKRLGAIVLHDAVWVLPATPSTRERFQWLATEIQEMEGSALVWEATLRLEGQDNALVDRFVAQAEAAYRDILAALGRPDADRAALSRQYQQVQTQDYFHVALGAVVREALAVATTPAAEEGDGMKWVTWEQVGVDRMACAWLIRTRIDPDAQFLFIPEGSSELPTDAEPFDIPGARLSHHGSHCSFHTMLEAYALRDPILAHIARIVDEADTVTDVELEPAAPGLDLLCRGLRRISPDDTAELERATLLYDALYAALAAGEA